MKTINPNSLVAITPTVLSVGGRPSPGVYSCPCCEAPSQISCDGATDVATFYSEAYFSSIEVNGVMHDLTFVDDYSAFLEGFGMDFTSSFTEAGFRKHFRNTTDQPLRIKLFGLVDIDIDVIENPTMGAEKIQSEEGDFDNSYIYFCLAPPEQAQISCAGATDYLGFEQLDGDWDTHVDSVFYPSPYDPAATIREHLSDIIEAQNDGFADFWNIDTTAPHRIMFVPRNTEGNPNSYILRDDNTNQSFGELPDGSLVFCLAAAGLGDCNPTSLHIQNQTGISNPPELGNVTIGILYQVNGGEIKSAIYVQVGYPQPAQAMWTVLSRVEPPIGNTFNESLFYNFDSLYNENDSSYTLVGLDQSLQVQPTTLRFLPAAGNEGFVDIYPYIFGNAEYVEVHSCGIHTYPDE